MTYRMAVVLALYLLFPITETLVILRYVGKRRTLQLSAGLSGRRTRMSSVDPYESTVMCICREGACSSRNLSDISLYHAKQIEIHQTVLLRCFRRE